MSASRPLAIVTGTTSGIGLALTRALLAAGWEVVGLARRAAPLEDPAYAHLRVDLGEPEDLRRAAEDELVPRLAAGERPRVGLVNNAAAFGALTWLRGADPADLARMFAVNAAAPLYLMGFVAGRVAPPSVLRIVNVSSGAARSPLPGLGDYAATKAALRMGGRALAGELAAEERTPAEAAVLGYEPGLVDTAMQDAAQQASAETFPAHDVFREFLERDLLNPPEAVVGEIVAFLDGAPDDHFVERRFGAD